MSEPRPRFVRRVEDPMLQMEMLLYQVIATFVLTGPAEGAIPEGLVVDIAEFLTPRTPFSFVQTDAGEALTQFIAEHTPTR